MPADLAPVYLDDTRVTLQGDPRPKVAKILQAGGRPPTATVLRLDTPSGPGRPVGAEDVIDRTGTPSRAVYLRTSRVAGDEGIGGVGQQGAFQSARPGHVQVPGEILRGTETRATPPTYPSAPSPASPPAGNPPAAQRFAENQSFADPVHKGGIRTQEGGSQEGGRTPRPASSTTTSRKSLQSSTEEE